MIQKTAFTVIKKERRTLSLMMVSAIGNSIAIAVQAWFFATLINNFVFLEHTVQDEYWTLMWLSIAVVIRLIFSYSQEHLASSLGETTKDVLRKQVIRHMFTLGIQRKEAQGDTIHLITDGLEQVDAYVARYIPQMLYAIITPLVMGIAIIDTMPFIGLILILTVPLIPFFMILIGKQAEKMNQEQWERMSFLSGHFLDVLRGITTLKVFGRAKEQIDVIARLSREFKDSTLRVLRVAFISALVLELVSTISTAIIAVYLGLTLLDGHIDFFSAFFILLLAPEFYAPFRQLGAAFHTGMSGKESLAKFESFMSKTSQLPIGGQLKSATPIQAIHINDLTYTYEDSANGVRHITIEAKRNEPIMLVGESGAGKSTIAHIVGGFLKSPKQTVSIDSIDLHDVNMAWWRSQVAFVSQKPHIMNGTLREAIAFGRSVTDEEILQAVHDAELDDVLATKGLDFVIGESGIGLSGGELQRVALARAFIGNPQVLILDEVTAHLDVHTENLISRALQRLMEDKIVILIGHRLQTMQWAKYLYVLRNGEIVEHGSYTDLLYQEGYFRDLVTAGAGVFQDTTFSETVESIEATHPNELLCGMSEFQYSQSKEVAQTNRHVAEGEQILHIAGEIDIDRPIDKPHRWEGWRLLFSVLSPAKWSLVLALFFTFLTVFMNVGLLSVSSWLLASAALQPGITYLSLAIVGVRFFGIGRAVSRYFERYTSHRMAFQGLYGLRVWFYTHLEPLAPTLFKRLSAGDILGRIMADIEILQFFYLRTLVPPLAAIFLTILVSYGVGTVDPRLSILVWGAAIVTGIVLPYVVYRYHQHSLRSISSAQGQLKSYLGDTLESIEDIISYNHQPATIARLEQTMEIVDNHKRRIGNGMNGGTTIFLGIVQAVVIIAACMAAEALSGPWASVMVAVCAIGIQAWFESLQPMLIAGHHGYESYLAVQRLVQIKHEQPPVVDRGNITIDSLSSIDFSHVRFSYTKDHYIYKDMSLSIPQGQTIAIVGPSGAGKTTMFSILERLYDYEGHISIGDIDLRNISIASWRNLVGTITQDTYVFHASLQDNIRLARPSASDDDIETVIHRAALRSVVERLPNGVTTIIGSGGMGLSGGEKQRIALARLFLRNPQLVLLDEPLEGLDQVTRKQLHDDLMAFTKDKTVLYITHQLDGLEKMDRILFMADGHIIEDGTFESLIKKRGAFYEYCKLARI